MGLISHESLSNPHQNAENLDQNIEHVGTPHRRCAASQRVARPKGPATRCNKMVSCDFELLESSQTIADHRRYVL